MRACDVSNVCAVSIGICGLVYTHAYLGEYARVCVCARVADSGSRLEIKTLCGTELVIELELKQKAEEHGVKKKKETGRGEGDGESSRRRRGVLSKKRRSERLPPLQYYSSSGLFLIRMSGRPFPLTRFCQQSS